MTSWRNSLRRTKGLKGHFRTCQIGSSRARSGASNHLRRWGTTRAVVFLRGMRGAPLVVSMKFSFFATGDQLLVPCCLSGVLILTSASHNRESFAPVTVLLLLARRALKGRVARAWSAPAGTSNRIAQFELLCRSWAVASCQWPVVSGRLSLAGCQWPVARRGTWGGVTRLATEAQQSERRFCVVRKRGGSVIAGSVCLC